MKIRTIIICLILMALPAVSHAIWTATVESAPPEAVIMISDPSQPGGQDTQYIEQKNLEGDNGLTPGNEVGDMMEWTGTVWVPVQISDPITLALLDKAPNDGVTFELSTLVDLTIGGSPLVDDTIIPSDPTAGSKLWTVARVGVMSQSQVFAEPDTLAGVTTTWPVISFPVEKFPNGVTITSVRVSTLTACTDSIDFEEWPMGSTSGTEVGSLTMSGTYTVSSLFTDANLAGDTTLYVRLPVSPTDTEFYDVNVTFLIK